MSVSFLSECVFCAFSLLLGGLFGIAYDVFRFFRAVLGIRVPQKKERAAVFRLFVLFFFDFFTMLFFGVVYCLFLYACHDGIFRVYSLAALTGGAVLYHFTLERAVRACLHFCAEGMRRMLSFLIHPFLPIIYWLLHKKDAFFAVISLSFSKIYGKIKEKSKDRNKNKKRDPEPSKKESYANSKRF